MAKSSVTHRSYKTTEDGRPVVRPRQKVGSAREPLLMWTGGKRGYLWIGDDAPEVPWLSCFVTLTTSEARKLRDMLDDALEGR